MTLLVLFSWYALIKRKKTVNMLRQRQTGMKTGGFEKAGGFYISVTKQGKLK